MGYFDALKTNLSYVVDAASAEITSAARRNKVDKPGGSWEEAGDRLKIISQKAGHHLTGSAYPEQYGTTKSGGGSDTDAEEELRGSKKGIQGMGKYAKTESEDTRREPYAMSPGTLLTQGQKAKKLTA